MTESVGYRRPPTHTRWRKGQSGNPTGGRKHSGDFGEDLLAELAEKIEITERGRTKRITKQRALIKALTAHGLKGNTRAANILIALCAKVLQATPDASASAEVSEADRAIVEDYLERELKRRLAAHKGGE